MRARISKFEFEFKRGDMSAGHMEANGLRCTCVVEHLDSSGQTLRKQVLKSAILDLGRNELQDVALRICHDSGTLGPLTIRQHTIHRRFVSEGKASIGLMTQKMQLLVSNCPPSQLKLFLQSISLKLAARGKLQGAKGRMLPDTSLGFDEISPLSERDLVLAAKNSGKVPPSTARCSLTTPKRDDTSGRAPKRKLSDISNTVSNRTERTISKISTSEPSNPAKKCRTTSLLNGRPNLSNEQAKILDMVKNGESVFFTGSAGTGKSYLLKQIIGALPPDSTFPTASTGSAACQIGGTTLHAFAGIGTGSAPLEQCIEQASREHKAIQWRKCRCLIIDEISMIGADYFDKLDAVAKVVRKCRKPFGGIQLVLCGDFLQLPPVTKDGEKKYCFQVSQLVMD